MQSSSPNGHDFASTKRLMLTKISYAVWLLESLGLDVHPTYDRWIFADKFGSCWLLGDEWGVLPGCSGAAPSKASTMWDEPRYRPTTSRWSGETSELCLCTLADQYWRCCPGMEAVRFPILCASRRRYRQVRRTGLRQSHSACGASSPSRTRPPAPAANHDAAAPSSRKGDHHNASARASDIVLHARGNPVDAPLGFRLRQPGLRSNHPDEICAVIRLHAAVAGRGEQDAGRLRTGIVEIDVGAALAAEQPVEIESDDVSRRRVWAIVWFMALRRAQTDVAFFSGTRITWWRCVSDPRAFPDGRGSNPINWLGIREVASSVR